VRQVTSLVAAVLVLGITLGAQAPKPTSPPPPTPAPATPQAPAPAPAPSTPPAPTAAPAQGITPPADYVIGTEDVLQVVVWREPDLSSEVMVRPDGMVSIPLLNDIRASGLTPDQFRQDVTKAAAKFVESPSVTVIVKAINSRKVFITGEVGAPGPYPLGGPTTVLQILAQAGGLREYADSKNITIMRTEGGKVVRLKFNYKDVAKGKGLEQNILLKPGDTIIVP
jgi:polysaccharide biosynthesis/export protein